MEWKCTYSALGKSFFSLSIGCEQESYVAPVAVDDPLINTKGAILTTKLTIRRRQRPENWRKLKLGPSYILCGVLFTSGLLM